MLKLKEIEIPIYNYTIEFVSGYIGEVVDYYRDVENVELGVDKNHAACTWDLGHKSVIWFDEDTITIFVMNHEIGHAIFNMMNCIGLELTDQEAFCYSQEYVLKEAVKYIQMN